MIPIKDNIPSRQVPYVTYILIGINAFVFLLEILLRPSLGGFFHYFGIVPIRYSLPDIREQFTLVEQLIPFFTSMFLHGGLLHILGNMWTLYIFGDNVEDYLGHLRFFLFYIACGVLAAIFHLLTNLFSQVPTIGASGAIAGVMGAYFLLYPHARVLVMIPIFFFLDIIEIPAFIFLGFWFFIQFFNGTFSLGTSNIYGGIAWWAHIGGFLGGLYIISLVRKYRYAFRY